MLEEAGSEEVSTILATFDSWSVAEINEALSFLHRNKLVCFQRYKDRISESAEEGIGLETEELSEIGQIEVVLTDQGFATLSI